MIPSVNSEAEQSKIEQPLSAVEVAKSVGANDDSIEVGEDESTDSSNASNRENKDHTDDENETKSLSDEYERIQVTLPIVRAELVRVAENLEDQEALFSNGVALKSKSDSERECSSMGLNGEYLVETLAEEKTSAESLIDAEDGKKKRHFARNVLHLVPEYLVRGQRKMRKKKKGKLSSSLSSLKPVSVNLKIEANLDSTYCSRSLSREDLKYLKISSPTNFVHVASATNPSLVLNENMEGFSLEQVVITHEQKCATLPLLVARDGNSTIGRGEQQRSIVIEKTPFVALIPGRSNQQNPRTCVLSTFLTN